jgi:hypothetical protein
MNDTATRDASAGRAARLAGWLAAGAVLLMLVSPLAFRMGLVGAGVALPAFGASMVLAALALLTGLAAVALTLRAGAADGIGKPAFSALIGTAALALAGWVALPGWDSPRVHDVTTAPADPPEFVVLRTPHYAGHEHVSYRDYDRRSGNRVSAAYPSLRTRVYDRSLRQVFRAAEQAAREMGWTLASVEPPLGRIEAVERSTLFGFIDDIVVRVRLNASGYTVLDVRSASRVPVVDLGRNAARIRRFLAAVDEGLRHPG